MLQHGRIGFGLQPGQQDRLLLAADLARATRDRLARERPRLALLHHRAFHRRHGYPKAARGFSHGLTVGHRAHQAFFEIGRIGSHACLPRTFRADVCLCFSQVALALSPGSRLASGNG
jgi:hypothetical protein